MDNEASKETLASFVIQLDQHFIAELGQTAATFSQIFKDEGQSRLLLVQISAVILCSLIDNIVTNRGMYSEPCAHQDSSISNQVIFPLGETKREIARYTLQSRLPSFHMLE